MKKLQSMLIGLTLLSVFGFAQAEQCSEHFADGKQPQVTIKALETKSTFLCYEGFAILHSGITRGPLWSAEHLTRSSLASASQVKRENDFHTEDKLPAEYRAELSDYSRSGFDRGHMSNSADAPTRSAQRETFTLANMVPQDPDNNRGLFEGIESAVRTLAKNHGELYVVTGPIYDGVLQGGSFKRLNGRVAIPTRIYKAVYDPHSHQAAAYIVDNSPGMQYKVVSIAELEKLVGINIYPNMSWAVKQVAVSLPTPTPHGFNKQTKTSHQQGSSSRHDTTISERELGAFLRLGMRFLRY